MRYAALLCVSAHNPTTYGSFIQAQLRKTFLHLALFSLVGLYFDFLLIPSDQKCQTTAEMAARQMSSN